MAFPPATLPTNRTNASPQQDTHPNDHNALAGAINDTVGRVQAHDGSLATINAQIADLFARDPILYEAPNAGVAAAGAGVWTQYGVGTLDLVGYTYNLLVTVSINIGSSGGGYCRLIGGLNGVQQAGAGEATAVHVAGANVWLTHTFRTVSGPGHLDIQAFGLSQNGGSIGPSICSVVATVA